MPLLCRSSQWQRACLPLLREVCNNLEMSLVLLQRHFSEQFLRVTYKWLPGDSLYTQQTPIKYELYHKHWDQVPGLDGETLKRNCFPQRVHNQQSLGKKKQGITVHRVKCHVWKLRICLEGLLSRLVGHEQLWGGPNIQSQSRACAMNSECWNSVRLKTNMYVHLTCASAFACLHAYVPCVWLWSAEVRREQCIFWN